MTNADVVAATCDLYETALAGSGDSHNSNTNA